MAKMLLAKTTTFRTFTYHLMTEKYGDTPEEIAATGKAAFDAHMANTPQAVKDQWNFGEFDRCIIVDDAQFAGDVPQPASPQGHEKIDIVDGALVFLP